MRATRPDASNEQKRSAQRRSRTVGAVGCVLVVGGWLFTATPAATADTPCTAALGGDWNFQDGSCSASVTSQRNAIMTMSVATPTDMLNDAVAGPVIRGYLHSLVDGWRKTGASMVRASDYGVVYQVYSHSPTVTSVVFHEYWQTVGNLANNAYRTFTFDHARGTQLQLADLIAPAALPPLARPYVSDALDQAPPPHDPNTYPFTIDNWEPQADGSGYSSNYRAFALTADELILYMPDAPMAHENPTPRDRFVWSMDGGAVTVHVPLTALGSALRAG